jgi:hypothetical protein
MPRAGAYEMALGDFKIDFQVHVIFPPELWTSRELLRHNPRAHQKKIPVI